MPHGLMRKALVCILPTAVALGVLAQFGARQLDLSAGYVAKVMAVFVAGAAIVLAGLRQHHPFAAFGAANAATTARGAVVALLAGLIGERGDGAAPALAVAAAVLVAVLDGADGWLGAAHPHGQPLRRAVRHGDGRGAGPGAAVLAWQFGKVGPWVVASGLLRYAFVASGLALPRLRAVLPPSRRRKTVAILQVAALIVALCPFVAPAVAAAVAAAGLCALSVSFLQDVRWLLGTPPPAHGSAVPP